MWTNIEELYDCFSRSTGVNTDSRTTCKGEMFIALRGENFNGNSYALQAIENGAAFAVVDDPEVATLTGRTLLVEDTLLALQQLAAYHREMLGIPILAISGSNGKTTTKELIYRTLSTKYNTSVTQGNLNNHIGVPLTLLRMNRDTEIGIVEMGANHCGEIAHLCAIARPNFGLLTNIGRAHLEGFGGEEGVKRGKGELFDFLDATGGTIFYNSDDSVVRTLAERKTVADKVPFSSENEFTQVTTTRDGFLLLKISGTTISTQMVGDYNRFNVAAALAVSAYFDVERVAAIRAIENYSPNNNRSQKTITALNTLYVDAYNANPSSMEAALRNFASLTEPDKCVILGDMMELGEYALTEHQRIVDLVDQLKIETSIFVGANFEAARRNNRSLIFANVEALSAYIQNSEIKNKHILIKGSRSVKLENIIRYL